MLCGLPYSDESTQIRTIHFERALENLRKFDFVSVVERLDESLPALARMLGVEAVSAEREHFRSGREDDRLEAGLDGRIKALNEFDDALWEEANRLLTRLLLEPGSPD
jgi:hypothetical protein